MKKFLNISLLALVALSVASLSSCKNEVDDIFDDDAIIRMNNAMDQYTDLLTSNGGKWQLEYYSNTEEPGYTYVLTFDKDGTVVMSGHNKWINYIKNNTLTTSAFGSMRSMWDVIGDNGLVLTFNSYNDYFHLFSTPDAIPTAGGTMTNGGGSTAGTGHEGDYEFNLMKYSGDTIYMTGKKYNLHMIMTRLPGDTDDETYLNEVALQNRTVFTSKLPYVFIVLPNGVRYVAKSAASGNMKIYREGEDEIMTSEYHNLIVTHDGMAFRDRIVLDGYPMQRFVRQADGTLLSVEDNQTIITADPLAACIGNTGLSWKNDLKNQIGGNYPGMITQINTELKKVNSKLSLSDAQISYVDSLSCYALTLRIKQSAQVQFPSMFYFQIASSNGNQMKMAFDGTRNGYADRYASRCPALEEFINILNATTFDLTSASLLAPTEIKMTDSSNKENFMSWTLQ